MAFRKPGTKKIGIKTLLKGEKGTGKTILALTFPKIAALDSENGMTFYEDEPEGKNLVLVDNTQDFFELEDTIDELSSDYEDLGIQTFLIDSETKFFNNINETIMTVEEKRAKQKGRDVLDANLSIRSHGKIKTIAEKLQNLKIDLTSQGVNLVSIAQVKDKKAKVGDDYVVVGQDTLMAKGAEYDYDLVLNCKSEEDEDGKRVYYAIVEKDRTKTFKEGDRVDNAHYDLWAAKVDKLAKKDKMDSKLSKGNAKERYEQQVIEEETPIEDRIRLIINTAKEQGDKDKLSRIKDTFTEAKIPVTMSGLTGKQMDKLKEIYEELK